MGHRGAGHADQPVAIDQRMARPAPERRFGLIVGLEVAGPEQPPVGDVQAAEVSLGAERVDAVAIDRWRAPRPGRIGDRVGHRILVLPEQLARGLIEAEHPFRAGGRLPLEVRDLHIGIRHVVGDEHPSRRDGRPCIAACDGRSPEHVRAGRGKRIEQAILPPDIVAVGPHPLGPVVADRGRHGGKRHA